MTLQRYIGGRVLRIFLTAFVAVLILISLVDMVELLRRSDGREDLFGPIAIMAFLNAPNISMEALPFIMLLSAMWAYMQLARSSELVSAAAAGDVLLGFGLARCRGRRRDRCRCDHRLRAPVSRGS